MIRRASERALAPRHAHEAVPRVLAECAPPRRRAARADDLRGDPRGVRLRALRRTTSAPPARRARSSSTCRSRSTPSVRRVQLVAPTSTDERIARRGRRDRRLALPRLASPARPARAPRSPPRCPAWSSAPARATDVPLYAGFGISTPEHARAAAELADGVVVGSRAVQVAEEGPAALRDVRALAARRYRRLKTARRSTIWTSSYSSAQLVQLRLPVVGAPARRRETRRRLQPELENRREPQRVGADAEVGRIAGAASVGRATPIARCRGWIPARSRSDSRSASSSACFASEPKGIVPSGAPVPRSSSAPTASAVTASRQGDTRRVPRAGARYRRGPAPCSRAIAAPRRRPRAPRP